MLPRGAIVGIIGSGQLGRMLAMAAASMGYRTHIFTPEVNSPAAEVATLTTVRKYDDKAALELFAQSVDVITFEFENIPDQFLSELTINMPIFPSPDILYHCRNRIREKNWVQAQGIGTAPFVMVRSSEELDEAIRTIGLPAILKTTEFGYDGKGQVTIRDHTQNSKALWESLKTKEAILEGFIDFTCELSVIVARDQFGLIACYEPALNIHRNHMLERSIVPSGLNEPVITEAKAIACKLAEAFELVGLLAVELFLLKDGRLLVNEMAPRPHNSGHWTIEAAATSQFEQLIRAVTGHSLGDTKLLAPCEMINLIGEDILTIESYAKNPQAHIHDYGKNQIRAGRKMGHVTLLK